MIVHIDTSALVDALTGPRRSLETLISLTDQGHRLALSTIVLYEWLRGPRTKADLSAQEALLPSEHAIGFGPAEAALAARLYKQVARPRGRSAPNSDRKRATSQPVLLNWTSGPSTPSVDRLEIRCDTRLAVRRLPPLPQPLQG